MNSFTTKRIGLLLAIGLIALAGMAAAASGGGSGGPTPVPRKVAARSLAAGPVEAPPPAP